MQHSWSTAFTTDADAKKNSYPVFKAGKHPALRGIALLDITATPFKISTNAKGNKPLTKMNYLDIPITENVTPSKPSPSKLR